MAFLFLALLVGIILFMIGIYLAIEKNESFGVGLIVLGFMVLVIAALPEYPTPTHTRVSQPTVSLVQVTDCSHWQLQVRVKTPDNSQNYAINVDPGFQGTWKSGQFKNVDVQVNYNHPGWNNYEKIVHLQNTCSS